MWFAYVFGHARKRSEGVTTGSDTRVASIRVGASEVRDVIVVVRDPTFLGRYRLPLDADRRLRSLRRSSEWPAGRLPRSLRRRDVRANEYARC